MSLRERMRAKSRATATFPLRIEDDSDARTELAAAQADGNPERIAAAQEALDACYEELRITALAPSDMEALIAAHPPVQDQQARWNPVTFVPALFAACVDSDVTEDEWLEYSTKGPMSAGEVNDLFDRVLGINYRTPPGPSLGKGSTPTRS